MTKVSQALFNEYKGLADQLANALDNRDQIAVTQINAKITAWALANKVDLTQVVEVDTTPTDDLGYIKPGGWGASTDVSKYKVVNMKNPPEQFKVVDDKGVNVIVNFKTAKGAQDYITAHQGTPVPPPVTCPPGQHKDASGKCVPDVITPPGPTGVDQFGIRKIHPDKPGGRFETNFVGREFERHYASGKPSENSFEYNQKAASADKNSDVEVTFYEKINGFKTNEPDTVSVKLTGPDHQDGNCCWVIPEFQTDGGAGKTLETEKPHPTNHGVNPKPLSPLGGSLIGKWIGIKAITYVKGGHRFTESYVHFPVVNIDAIATEQGSWRQYIPTTQVSDDYLKANGVNTLNRLDGTAKGSPPTFKFSSVREIQV